MNTFFTYKECPEENLHQLKSKSEKCLLVLFFTAKWLGSGHIMEVMLGELANNYQQVTFYHVDVDTDKSLCESLNLSRLPAAVFLRDGQVSGRVSGVVPKSRLRGMFDDFCRME